MIQGYIMLIGGGEHFTPILHLYQSYSDISRLLHNREHLNEYLFILHKELIAKSQE